LVVDLVEVVSRAAGPARASRRASDAKAAFTPERATRGTFVTLHLRSEQDEFLREWRLRELITRYSDYVSHVKFRPR
jgi:molecular chaperone HtpG